MISQNENSVAGNKSPSNKPVGVGRIAKKATKLVVATDVRFWHKKTGAERRIFAMLDYLRNNGMEITTLFVGSLANHSAGKSLQQERQTIAAQNLKVISLLEDWQPNGLWRRMVWQAKCIANLFKTRLNQQPARTFQPAPSRGRHLADFHSPMFLDRFRQLLTSIQPDVVLVEYITLAYLAPGNRGLSDPRWFVDTHDFLSDRYDQFRQNGFDHWIRICRAEEAGALKQFDTIIAIQGEEQQSFQDLIGHSREVIVAGHPSDALRPSTVEETVNAPYRIGYFASDNPSNVQALEWFISSVWPMLVSRVPDLSMLVGGTICNSLKPAVVETPGLAFQPEVTETEDLYQSFCLAINPVQFGTGLKIKNQEALAHGKPVIVTRQGFTGMTPPTGFSPIFVAQDAGQMCEHIVRLLSDEQLIRKSADAALRYAREHLTPDSVYQNLLGRLRGELTNPVN